MQSDGINDWQPLLDTALQEPHVVAAAPAIYEQVLISRGPRARGAVLKGMIPAYERKVSDLLESREDRLRRRARLKTSSQQSPPIRRRPDAPAINPTNPPMP